MNTFLKEMGSMFRPSAFAYQRSNLTENDETKTTGITVMIFPHPRFILMSIQTPKHEPFGS
jgi:hypothetical protein